MFRDVGYISVHQASQNLIAVGRRSSNRVVKLFRTVWIEPVVEPDLLRIGHPGILNPADNVSSVRFVGFVGFVVRHARRFSSARAGLEGLPGRESQPGNCIMLCQRVSSALKWGLALSWNPSPV